MTEKSEKERKGFSETSEKGIEAYLSRLVRGAGGLSLKYSSGTQVGYPDRVLLMPGGVCGWVEVKSAGKKPTRLQEVRIAELRSRGFYAEVCDSQEKARHIVSELKLLAEIMQDSLRGGEGGMRSSSDRH